MRSPTATNALAPIVIGIGDLAISNSAPLTTHALGSCVSVCLWDGTLHLGGLLHLMLPQSEERMRRHDQPAMFADTGIALLFRQIIAAGARKERIRAWLVGGSNVTGASLFAVGQRNIEASRRILWSRRVVVLGEDVGGKIPRTVVFDPIEGKVRVKSPFRSELVL